ncbi:hypothetical protein NEOKW01_1450 [Nematocida sp. AWRm80]|nr:hypothetical protein NEOKW01_1450 [Nematocida sp. AWRm80]
MTSRRIIYALYILTAILLASTITSIKPHKQALANKKHSQNNLKDSSTVKISISTLPSNPNNETSDEMILKELNKAIKHQEILIYSVKVFLIVALVCLIGLVFYAVILSEDSLLPTIPTTHTPSKSHCNSVDDYNCLDSDQSLILIDPQEGIVFNSIDKAQMLWISEIEKPEPYINKDIIYQKQVFDQEIMYFKTDEKIPEYPNSVIQHYLIHKRRQCEQSHIFDYTERYKHTPKDNMLDSISMHCFAHSWQEYCLETSSSILGVYNPPDIDELLDDHLYNCDVSCITTYDPDQICSNYPYVFDTCTRHITNYAQQDKFPDNLTPKLQDSIKDICNSVSSISSTTHLFSGKYNYNWYNQNIPSHCNAISKYFKRCLNTCSNVAHCHRNTALIKYYPIYSPEQLDKYLQSSYDICYFLKTPTNPITTINPIITISNPATTSNSDTATTTATDGITDGTGTTEGVDNTTTDGIVAINSYITGNISQLHRMSKGNNNLISEILQCIELTRTRISQGCNDSPLFINCLITSTKGNIFCLFEIYNQFGTYSPNTLQAQEQCNTIYSLCSSITSKLTNPN